MGVRDYELEDYDRRDRRRARDERWEEDDRGYDRPPRTWRRTDDREEAKKEPLSKREPVRIAGAVATLVTTGAVILFGVEVTTEQQTQIRDLILLAIPVIVPVIASFEVARSKVDSPVTVERRLREESNR